MSTPAKLSLLWIFLTVNYIFCDVFTLFHGPTLSKLLTGTMDGMEINEQFLLGFGILMELPMLMILGARFLPEGMNRIANLAVAALMTLVQSATVFAGGSTLHYLFFSAVEIATTVVIFWMALRWRPQTDARA